jgi:hypothetical protein
MKKNNYFKSKDSLSFVKQNDDEITITTIANCPCGNMLIVNKIEFNSAPLIIINSLAGSAYINTTRLRYLLFSFTAAWFMLKRMWTDTQTTKACICRKTELSVPCPSKNF